MVHVLAAAAPGAAAGAQPAGRVPRWGRGVDNARGRWVSRALCLTVPTRLPKLTICLHCGLRRRKSSEGLKFDNSELRAFASGPYSFGIQRPIFFFFQKVDRFRPRRDSPVPPADEGRLVADLLAHPVPSTVTRELAAFADRPLPDSVLRRALQFRLSLCDAVLQGVVLDGLPARLPPAGLCSTPEPLHRSNYPRKHTTGRPVDLRPITQKNQLSPHLTHAEWDGFRRRCAAPLQQLAPGGGGLRLRTQSQMQELLSIGVVPTKVLVELEGEQLQVWLQLCRGLFPG